MRRIVVLAMAILIVALLTVPVFAAFRVISDTFDRGSGTGVAIVQVSDTLFAEILYRDVDGSESLTDGDQRLKTKFFSRAVKPAGRSLDQVQPARG